MHTITHITDRITLVMLNVAIWSGRKKLRAEDLKLGTEVPPEELVSLGSKRVCDPEPLRIFHRIKKGAERTCLQVGTRFLGGFAVPHAHAESIAESLAVLKVEFDTETRAFLAGYDRALEEWISNLPAWEEPIRRAIEPAEVVGTRLRFGYQIVRIAPAEQPGTLEEEVQGLGDGIFAEVEQMARELEGSFEGKEKLHRRALGTFRRIREKLACLSFVDRRIHPVVDTLDDWFARLPDGPIDGPIFNEGMGLALLLADAERMARHGAGQWAVQQGGMPSASDPEDTEAEVVPLPTERKTTVAASPLAVQSAMDFEAEMDALFSEVTIEVDDIDMQDHPPEPACARPVEETVADVEGFFF
ncbi:MAG: DUF3150 domain-containing protein [Thiocapsa sp.]|uniref:DUF3150 domain-containing protein n=1 Tax=Thiocapsa sp. TaxID=2024551 RepID=UPI001BCEEBF6|nr:DUF3150 domain-containing protein [Thiocapsa sp.]QVL49529.1 MAG: DUF3150 domain-containing protein [Thiocapsa sp.]